MKKRKEKDLNKVLEELESKKKFRESEKLKIKRKREN